MASAHPRSPFPATIAGHYASGYESGRLERGGGQLERERARELLSRFLPPPPCTVLDIGGGPGAHACWLATRGYEVHLIDITRTGGVILAAAISRFASALDGLRASESLKKAERKPRGRGHGEHHQQAEHPGG